MKKGEGMSQDNTNTKNDYLRNADTLAFAELLDGGALFSHGDAYLPVMSKLGARLIREFRQQSGEKMWSWVGEGRATAENYPFLPSRFLEGYIDDSSRD